MFKAKIEVLHVSIEVIGDCLHDTLAAIGRIHRLECDDVDRSRALTVRRSLDGSPGVWMVVYHDHHESYPHYIAQIDEVVGAERAARAACIAPGWPILAGEDVETPPGWVERAVERARREGVLPASE